MKIDVIFRTAKSDGEVVAYFPYEIHAGFTASCYCYNGQHLACSHDYILKETVPCLNFEELKNELENNVGYSLNVIQKRNHSKYIKAVINQNKPQHETTI